MIQVREQLRGAGAARSIMAKLEELGIKDIQLFFDNELKMWAVVQVKYKNSNLILPKSYAETSQEPYLLWWCKNSRGAFREPNLEDLSDIIKVVTRAPDIWAEGDKRADKFEEQDAEKDRKHKENFHDKIHTIAPAMKQAIQKGKL